MSPEEFAEIEARLAATTEGPWARSGHDIGHIVYDSQGPSELAGPVMLGHLVGEAGYEDAEFIAHAREDIPRLLAAVRERDNTIARVRDIVESVHVSDDLDPDGYQVAGLIRAALDPQETE